MQRVAVIISRSTIAHKKRGLDAHCVRACVLGVIRRYRFYLSLVNIMYSLPLSGSPATRKVLSCYFNVFFPNAISSLAVSISASRSLWVASSQVYSLGPFSLLASHS